MNFCQAIEAAKKGQRIARSTWSTQWFELVPPNWCARWNYHKGSYFIVVRDRNSAHPLSWFTPEQVLAEDWVIVEGERSVPVSGPAERNDWETLGSEVLALGGREELVQ